MPEGILPLHGSLTRSLCLGATVEEVECLEISGCCMSKVRRCSTELDVSFT